MIPISIDAEALCALAKSFQMGWRAEGSLDGKGGYLLTLPRGVAELLSAMRQPGESFSGVMVRVASDRRLKSVRHLNDKDLALALHGLNSSVDS